MHLQFNALRATSVPLTRTPNRILNAHMIRPFVTVFAGLLGLAFGSFLNVCISRWPENESIVQPRSHCRNCEHRLAWWENIPLLSWILLRGRCRECRTWIGLRYPLVELMLAAMWAYTAWVFEKQFVDLAGQVPIFLLATIFILGQFAFYWLLVALAALDAEQLWLPNFLTLPGIALGFLVFVFYTIVHGNQVLNFYGATAMRGRMFRMLWGQRLLAIVVAAGLLLLIRWLYWVIRHVDGMGLGDVKLMAMLAAWLGLPATLLAFFIGAMVGAVAGLVVIAVPAARDEGEGWANTKLPFGTFLCIGGIISSLWGQPIIAAYLHFVGF